MKVDLNADIGESFGNYKCGLDDEVIPFISSANIACGFHAADPIVMDRTVSLAKETGLLAASEVFADRAYNDDGSLVDRSKPGAVITDEDLAIERVIEIVKNGTVSSITGKKITVKADSVCLHGDGIKAVEFAKKINAALNSEGISILPIGTVIKEA